MHKANIWEFVCIGGWSIHSIHFPSVLTAIVFLWCMFAFGRICVCAVLFYFLHLLLNNWTAESPQISLWYQFFGGFANCIGIFEIYISLVFTIKKKNSVQGRLIVKYFLNCFTGFLKYLNIKQCLMLNKINKLKHSGALKTR